MGVAKIAVSIDEDLLDQLDQLVGAHAFPNRSRAIAEAVAEKLARLRVERLARECAMLNPEDEKALAEEGMGSEGGEWPAY